MKTLEVAAGLIFRFGQVLVCQRKENGPFPLKWEFPGGKLQGGEGYENALRRELNEELGIEVTAARELFFHRHTYPGAMTVDLRFFEIQEFVGDVRNLAFRRIEWVKLDRLIDYDFLEGDLVLIQKLSGPDGNKLIHNPT